MSHKAQYFQLCMKMLIQTTKGTQHEQCFIGQPRYTSTSIHKNKLFLYFSKFPPPLFFFNFFFFKKIKEFNKKKKKKKQTNNAHWAMTTRSLKGYNSVGTIVIEFTQFCKVYVPKEHLHV